MRPPCSNVQKVIGFINELLMECSYTGSTTDEESISSSKGIPLFFRIGHAGAAAMKAADSVQNCVIVVVGVLATKEYEVLWRFVKRFGNALGKSIPPKNRG